MKKNRELFDRREAPKSNRLALCMIDRLQGAFAIAQFLLTLVLDPDKIMD